MRLPYRKQRFWNRAAWSARKAELQRKYDQRFQRYDQNDTMPLGLGKIAGQ